MAWVIGDPSRNWPVFDDENPDTGRAGCNHTLYMGINTAWVDGHATWVQAGRLLGEYFQIVK